MPPAQSSARPRPPCGATSGPATPVPPSLGCHGSPRTRSSPSGGSARKSGARQKRCTQALILAAALVHDAEEHEEHVLRPLGEAAHVIRVPLGAVGNVDADRPALTD